MKKFALAGLTFLLPIVTFAQTTDQPIDSLQGLANFVVLFINNILVPLVFAISFLVFIFGVFKYFIQGAGNPETRAEGRNVIIYSIIGFFAMVSVWGLVHILTGTILLRDNPIQKGQLLPQTAPIQNTQTVSQ